MNATEATIAAVYSRRHKVLPGSFFTTKGAIIELFVADVVEESESFLERDLRRGEVGVGNVAVLDGGAAGSSFAAATLRVSQRKRC